MKKIQIKKAVVAVLLPREHLPFIREWCIHHLNDGWDVFLYDNTGSQGSQRESSVFSYGHLQKQNVDKRGNHYGRYTEDLSDEEVSNAMVKEVEGLEVRVISWQPLDDAGSIIHGQVEAYVHFIREYGDGYKWAAFIDADEYLHAGKGLAWDALLQELEGWGCHRLMIDGHVYESRWTPDGLPIALDSLACCGRQPEGNKNIVRPDKVIRADIHWGWLMEGSNHYASVDSLQFYFRHYKGEMARHLLSLKPASPGLNTETIPVRGVSRQQPEVNDEDLCPPALIPWKISPEVEDFLTKRLPSLVPAPNRILELGPGYSTLVFAKTYPQAAITSVEHDRNWLFQELGKLSGRSNIELLLAPLDAESRWYALDPSRLPQFDILLVDGPPGWIAPKVRAKATSLRGNLADGAVVILNNTDRDDEAESVARWCDVGLEVVEKGKGFTALQVTPDEAVGRSDP